MTAALSEASQEQSADIIPEVLDAHKKKLSRMRKWKRKLEVVGRRKQEKEKAWADELKNFRDGARICMLAAVDLCMTR